jgi:hypothetical protein
MASGLALSFPADHGRLPPGRRRWESVINRGGGPDPPLGLGFSRAGTTLAEEPAPYAGGTVIPLPLVFDAPKKGMPPQHLADLDVVGRREEVVRLGEKAFRAEQLSRHYFAGRGLADMSDLGAASRELLAPLLPPLLTRVRDVDCDNGATVNTLWRAHDGTRIESVTMRYRDRTTVCISSPAGCGMACPFCATGQGGLTRNLSTAEIVDQAVQANADEIARGHERGVTNLVYMGMGVTQRAVFTTRSARVLTCGFAVRGLVRGLRCGVADGAMGRRWGARLGGNVGLLAGVGCCGGGRARRGCSMTRRACR